MHALNQLVARSIIDPNIVQSHAAGLLDDVIGDYEFAPEVKKRLSGLEANSFAEFTLLAYRVVKAAEVPVRTIELPSPAEGLFGKEDKSDREHVA
jgi:hypothetical protein